MRIQATTRLFLLRHLLIGALLLIPLLGAHAVYTAYAATTEAEARMLESANAEIVTATKISEPAAEVAETSPAPATTAPAASRPAPAAPTPAPAVDRLIMPSIGLNAQFVTVGLASNGAVDVHPSLVGWWNGSAQPGSPGAAFLDGHSPGVLSALSSAQTGSTFSLQKADGQTFTYTIVFRETVALSSVDMRKALSVYGGASEGVNIMTCAGTYIPSMGTTDQRLIVYAVRS